MKPERESVTTHHDTIAEEQYFHPTLHTQCIIHTIIHTHIHIQLSYASATSSLNDRTRFPNFWRTYSSNDNLAQSMVAVAMHYGWMQLKIITQDELLFMSVSICLQSVNRMHIDVITGTN